MEKTGGSRLLQMQARFQQKQLQEREMKIASLYEAQQTRALERVRHSPGSISPPQPPAPIPHHPGKVRQMFEERRTKAGIDKSYPLQPIHNTERAANRKALPNGFSKVTSTTTKTVEKRATKTHITTHAVKKQQHKIENMVNGSGDLNHNHEPDLNTTKHVLPKSNGELISRIESLDKVDNSYLLEDETFPDALAPTPTPRSPEPREKPHQRSPAPRATPPRSKPQVTAAPPRRVTSDNAVSESSKARGAMQRTVNAVPKRQSSPTKPRSSTASAGSASAASPTSGGSGGSGAACSVCGRRFAPDRLAKHEQICRKAHAKKRKPFDALKHRLAGTEAEPFIGKLRKSTVQAAKPPAKPLNNNWRQKHEEFISAIRAAKQVQAHLNAGGKLSDLPPPPPSENPDYVQCPHCSRRFNKAAAERHIPKCANYQFNKPKPNAKKR